MGTKYNPASKRTDNVQYFGGLVKKSIHVIRDPFSNIVSRFLKHFKRQYIEAASPLSKVLTYNINNDKAGFQEYCRRLDEHFYKHEHDMFPHIMSNSTLIKNVPCRSEFYKFMQWHNLAFVATREIHPMPVMVLHYEDYCEDINVVLDDVLEFIELGKKESYNIRQAHCHYHDSFFDVEQLIALQEFMRFLGSEELLTYLERYFRFKDS